MLRVGRQYFLHSDRMLPAVAKVVDVHCLRAHPAKHAKEARLVEILGTYFGAHGRMIRQRTAEATVR